MSTWDFKILRNAVSSKLKSEELDRLNLYMNSFHWKNVAINYHLTHATECFENYLDYSIDEFVDFSNRLLNNKVEADFYEARTGREVSIIAAVNTVHTLPEILCQIITLALQVPNGGINSVSFRNTCKSLPIDSLNNKLNELMSSYQYKYINAFTNMSKHICLVKPLYTLEMDGSNYHGIRFDSFDFKGKSYDSIRDDELIDYVNQFKSECINIGSTIVKETC